VGYSPSRKGKTKAKYLSPLANENEASFVVDTIKNRWRDYGRGKGGDTIDFVIAHENCTFREAIDLILDGKISRPQHQAPTGMKASTVEIIDVKDIVNPHLIRYAESRGISKEILLRHCKEVDFVFSEWDHVTHIAIGFQNHSGGWELRSPSKKVGNSPKTWSMVRGTVDISSCDVFEGFFDFLSHLEYHKILEPELDTFILNSLSFCEWVKPELEMYSLRNLYLDNNPPARERMKDYFSEEGYYDRSDVFAEFEDYNEFLKSIK
jgi:hypothetical protein